MYYKVIISFDERERGPINNIYWFGLQECGVSIDVGKPS